MIFQDVNHSETEIYLKFKGWSQNCKLPIFPLRTIKRKRKEKRKRGKEGKREEWSWEYDPQKPGDMSRNQNALIEQPLSEKSN